MARYVIDAPTLLHLVDKGVAPDPGVQLVAPSSIRSEALELLLRDVLAGRRTEREALDAHTRQTEVKIRTLGDRVSRATAFRIAREQGWDTLRDAEHLALVRLQADALVTVDAALAARAEGLVPLAPVGALAGQWRPAGGGRAGDARGAGPDGRPQVGSVRWSGRAGGLPEGVGAPWVDGLHGYGRSRSPRGSSWRA